MRAGARRVSNLSEEQRNKKRENDRIAQQNIRRRNKELIEKLQQEVEFLRKLDRVDLVKRLMRRNKDLEEEVLMLRKTLFLHTGRPYPASGTPFPCFETIQPEKKKTNSALRDRF